MIVLPFQSEEVVLVNLLPARNDTRLPTGSEQSPLDGGKAILEITLVMVSSRGSWVCRRGYGNLRSVLRCANGETGA
jgi:hypothetical protein